MAESANHIVLTRREVLFLSAMAGVSIATGTSALACDRIKTGAHQEPCKLLDTTLGGPQNAIRRVRRFVDGGVLTFEAVRVAHRRTAVLLQQQQALRTGDRQYTPGASARQDGFPAGCVRCHRQPERIWGLTWQPTAPETNTTMVWDNECRMVNDPEGEARKIMLTSLLTRPETPALSGNLAP